MSSPLGKNILIFGMRKSVYIPCHPVPNKRGVAHVTNAGTGCGGRGQFCKTSGTDADGEVVWSRHPDAGVKSAGIPAEVGG